MGYVDRMRAKSPANWGVQMMGMNCQTRSRESPYVSVQLWEKAGINRKKEAARMATPFTDRCISLFLGFSTLLYVFICFL